MRNRGFNKRKLSLWLNIHSEPNISALTQEIFVISREREKQRQNPCWSIVRMGYWEKQFPGSPRIPRKWFQRTKEILFLLRTLSVKKVLSLKVVQNEVVRTQFQYQNKILSVCPTALLTQKQDRERLCCIFPGSRLEYKKTNWHKSLLRKLQFYGNQKVWKHTYSSSC